MVRTPIVPLSRSNEFHYLAALVCFGPQILDRGAQGCKEALLFACKYRCWKSGGLLSNSVVVGSPCRNGFVRRRYESFSGGNNINSNYTDVGLGGAGGSGVVILKYPDSNPAATSTTGSPTITTSGSYTIIKFTSSGTYTA